MATVKKTKRSRTKKPTPTPKVAAKKLPVAQSAKPATQTPTMHAPKRLSSGWRHIVAALRLLRGHWKFFTLFSLLYAVLSLVFVHNIVGDIPTLKSQLSTVVGGNPALTGLSTYALLVTTGSSPTSGAAVYQYVLLVMFSLAVIFALRHFYSANASRTLRVRDSLYDGMFPLVPFILVLLVLALELLPFAAGGSLLATLIGNNIAVTFFERFVAVLIFLALTSVSVWLLTRTMFALYIVTLPGNKPVQSLKDSRRITKGRQLSILRKLLFLALVLVLFGAVVLVPVIIVFAPLASVLLFVLGVLLLPFVHTFFYGIYRELIA